MTSKASLSFYEKHKNVKNKDNIETRHEIIIIARLRFRLKYDLMFVVSYIFISIMRDSDDRILIDMNINEQFDARCTIL